MAGYSVVCYLLAIKDRHNGNIMLDSAGHIIHIDFGFVFGLAPGKQASMETAPWKMTEEMLEVMGGEEGSRTLQFKKLCTACLVALKKHSSEILGLLEIMAYKSNFPSLQYNSRALRDLRGRLMLDVPDDELPGKVDEMFRRSARHMGTVLYDRFQLATNNIAP